MDRLILERVLKTIRNYEMVKGGDKVLAAVSGGPDSVFMLMALYGLRNKLGIKKLAVCSLDHGIRGKESAGDLSFVSDLADKLRLEFISEKIRLMEKKGLSVEETAREARYEFFRRASEKCGVDLLATGHTLDDQAETIIMRVIKGASLKGALGISPVRIYGKLKVVRPLIEFEKSEIVNYLDGAGVPYVVDRTNLDMAYFRNAVRSEIIPFLERYNPRLKRALFNLSEHMREDFRFIEEAVSAASAMVKIPGSGHVRVKIEDIAVQPSAVQKEILRNSLEKAGGKIKKLSFRHWKEMESIIRRKGKGSSLDLPGGIRIEHTGDSLIFGRIPDALR